MPKTPDDRQKTLQIARRFVERIENPTGPSEYCAGSPPARSPVEKFVEARAKIWKELREIEARMRADGLI